MIAMESNAVRRPRGVACLAVAIASLLSASGMVMAERLTGRDLSVLLADVIRPDSERPLVAGHGEAVAAKSPAAGSPSAPSGASQAASPAPTAGQLAAAGSSAASQPAGSTPVGRATRPTKGGGTSPAPAAAPSGAGSGSAPAGSSPGSGTGAPGAGQGGAIPGPVGGDLGGTIPAAGGNSLEQEVDALKPFVEREVGHTFKAAVPVRILSDAEFSTRLAELNWLPKAEAAEQLEGVYRAFGLIGDGVDLPTELAKFSRPEFVTLYDAVAGQLLIRNREASPYMRTMLVRELTRALDDQYFDIYRPTARGFEEEALEGLKALAEGDATRVADKYKASLSATDRA
ncbi:MAG TPA: hypothetical protein VGL92_01980, partial [Acidimicrobiia bacterium]